MPPHSKVRPKGDNLTLIARLASVSAIPTSIRYLVSKIQYYATRIKYPVYHIHHPIIIILDNFPRQVVKSILEFLSTGRENSSTSYHPRPVITHCGLKLIKNQLKPIKIK
jgi:hypothetical protein